MKFIFVAFLYLTNKTLVAILVLAQVSLIFEQDRTALLFLLFPSALLILRSWLWDGCLPTFPVQLYQVLLYLYFRIILLRLRFSQLFNKNALYFQAWLLFLYTGLALRENILRVNGSDIRRW